MLEHVALRGARGADRRQARPPDARPARRPDPVGRPRDRRGADASASRARARRERRVRARLRRRPGDAALPRRARASRPATRFEVVDSQPFDGPLFVRFGDDVHVLGGALARAMRVRPREPAAARRSRRRAPPGPCPQRPPLRRVRARGRVRGVVALLGPAFVAAVAYIDPGNFATNIAGGAKYGYLLVWVIVAANLMAMLVQYLSAKTGIATGRNLPELCREHFPRPVTWGLWVQAEVIAIATDLAEFVGAAIALNLLFGVPPFAAGLITAVVAFAILALQTRGYRRFELAIAGFLGIVCLGFLYDLLQVGVDARRVRRRPHPALRRHRQHPARRRHPRRDRDAARRLPALGAHAATGSRRRRPPSGASCCASSASTCSLAMGLAGRHQHHDARRRRRAVPRLRAHRRRHDRGRARRLRARCSAAARRSPSRSRCWPPACRARASARSPARS